MLQDWTERKADKTQISELEEKLANFPTLGQQSLVESRFEDYTPMADMLNFQK
jgi:hypothetical protein